MRWHKDAEPIDIMRQKLGDFWGISHPEVPREVLKPELLHVPSAYRSSLALTRHQ